MANITEIYFKKETLETLVKTLTAKNEPGVRITVTVSDDVKEFKRQDGKIVNQNASAYVSQSKEDREAGKDKFYVANGRQVWCNDIKSPSPKAIVDPSDQQFVQEAKIVEDEQTDLPF
jgi:predicted GH43/DUF377 family glycosyl hydrolase